MAERKEEQAPKREKKVEHKGKKVRKGKKHVSIAAHKAYKVDGSSVTRAKKQCPRCGAGTWLGAHKGRFYCGKCHYTIFDKKEIAK